MKSLKKTLDLEDHHDEVARYLHNMRLSVEDIVKLYAALGLSPPNLLKKGILGMC